MVPKRWLPVCLVAAALVSVMPAGAQAASAATATTATVQELLNALPVTVEQPAGYDRGLFPHWVDADHDGCDTRQEVLIAESTVPVTPQGSCPVTSGQWQSWYDGATWTNPADVDIDHMVPLAEAWASGAYAWTTSQRQAYANDLALPDVALVAVTDNVNQAKSDQDPAEWLPPVDSVRCRYITDWVDVKYRWNLSVDSTELAALNSLLQGQCTGATTDVPPRAVTPSSGALADRLVTVGTDGQMWLRRADSGTWTALGGQFIDAPIVVSSGSGVYFIGVGGDHNLWIRSFGQYWQRLAPVGTNCAGASAVISVNRLAVACRGGDNAVWVSTATVPASGLPTLAGWSSRGGSIRYGVSVSDTADYTSSSPQPAFTYSAVGGDNRPWLRTDSIGWQLAANAACGDTFSAAGDLRAAGCRDLNSTALRVIRYPGSGSTSSVLSSQISGRPGLTADSGTGTTSFYVLGGDRAVWVVSQTAAGQTSGFTRLGGTGVHGVAATRYSANADPAPVMPPPPPSNNPPPPPPPPSSPPANPGDSKNCSDFATWRDAQNWFDYYYPYYGDVARLDSDNDRIACESLPGHP